MWKHTTTTKGQSVILVVEEYTFLKQVEDMACLLAHVWLGFEMLQRFSIDSLGTFSI